MVQASRLAGIAVIALLLSARADALAQGSDPQPKITSSPVITGIAQVGETLTATPGEWTPAPPSTTASHQWFRCTSSSACEPIAGATIKLTYQVNPADQEHTLLIRLTVRLNRS
jgi:hypothetical protein